MLFQQRIGLANKLLADSALEGQRIMLIGSGIWFEALESCCTYLLYEHFPHYIGIALQVPALRVDFDSGGTLQCVDLSDGRNMNLLNPVTNLTPQVIYLAEDACGVHAYLWKKRIEPFLYGTACRIVYLGGASDESS
jgi:hypothetical protein